MEGSRAIQPKRASPSIQLSNESFSFVKDFNVGDKGELKFSAVIDGGRVDEEADNEDNLIKYLQVTSLSNSERTRITK